MDPFYFYTAELIVKAFVLITVILALMAVCVGREKFFWIFLSLGTLAFAIFTMIEKMPITPEQMPTLAQEISASQKESLIAELKSGTVLTHGDLKRIDFSKGTKKTAPSSVQRIANDQLQALDPEGQGAQKTK